MLLLVVRVVTEATECYPLHAVVLLTLSLHLGEYETDSFKQIKAPLGAKPCLLLMEKWSKWSSAASNTTARVPVPPNQGWASNGFVRSDWPKFQMQYWMKLKSFPQIWKPALTKTSEVALNRICLRIYRRYLPNSISTNSFKLHKLDRQSS
jgi:hypothetical protein